MALYPIPADSSFDIGDGRMMPDPDIMETGRVPVEAYTSDERFELEREIFGKVWLNVGRVEEIPNPGDWVVHDIDVRSVSAIIVRGKDMKIRAFHNICSHRGMKLVWDAKGKGGKFSCPYHAWLYNSAGELTNIPDQKCFPHVDKKESGLTPIACDSWEGFIFINLAKEPKQTLREYLGPVADRLDGAPFGDYPYFADLSQEVEANWKLGVDAASEGYHVQVLHDKSVGGMLASKDNPHLTFLDWQPLGPHRLGTVPRNPGYTLPAGRLVQKFASGSAGQMIMEGEADETQSSTGFLGHPGINRIKTPVFQSDQFMIFPNFSIHITINGWWTTTYWPLSRGRSRWRGVWYYKKPQSRREEFALQCGVALTHDITVEDNSCFQKQQTMLESRAKPYIQFGEQEMLLRHLVAVISGIEKGLRPVEDRLEAAE